MQILQFEQQQNEAKVQDDATIEVELMPKVHSKTIILLIAIVGGYFAQVFNIVGAGYLGYSITAVVGGTGQETWFAASMAIGAASLGPPISQAADYWGRKWFVVVLSVCGCIGCIIVSRSNSIGMAIAGQAVASLTQGAQPVLHAISSEIIPRRYRPLAQTSVNIAGALGGILGLLIGGALTKNSPSGFRIFWYLSAGFYAVTTLIIILLYNPPSRELQNKFTTFEKLARLDWIGFFLLISGLVLFSVSLTSSLNPYHWTNPHILATFIPGAVLLIAFFVHEWKFTNTGLLHHGLFSRGRNFAIAELCILVEGVVFFASNNYFAYEIVAVYGLSLRTAGLYYTVAWFAYIVSTTLAGLYCSRTKTVRVPVMLAFGSFIVFNILQATLGLSSVKQTMGNAVFMGLGLGIALNALIVTSQLSTPPELISTATGLMIATRSFGGTLGLSIYTAIFYKTISQNLAKKVAAKTLPLGLNPASLGDLIAALASGNTAGLKQIPGLSPKILDAALLALKESYALCFRYIWISAGCFSVVALIGAFFIVDPKAEFNSNIDAPVEVKRDSTGMAATKSSSEHIERLA